MLDAAPTAPGTAAASPGRLMVEQFRLELEMLDGGLARFRRQEETAHQRGEAGVGGRYMLRRLLQPAVDAVRAFLADANSSKAGRRHTAAPLVEACGAEEAAYLALRTTLNAATAAAGEGVMLQRVAVQVGRAVETELWMRAFKAKNQELFDVTMAEVEKHTADKQRHSIARKMARRAEIEGEWSERTRFLVGLRLVELVKDATGIIKFELTAAGSRRSAYKLFLTPEAAERIADVQEAAAQLTPALLPTIIPPKPWSSTKQGGYHSGLFKRLRLVKTWSNALLEELDNLDMKRVLAAINAAQETPWRINARVLEVLERCLETERPIAGLPGRVEEVPPYPAEADHDSRVKRAWKRAAAKVYDMNRRSLSKRLQAAQTVSIARRFVGRDAIYFPHQMDFRGRIYPLPALLNLHGPDYARALLTFARAYPIEEVQAADWLMISGANHYGVDKCSLAARKAWVEQNMAAIQATDEDPWGPAFDFWTKADKPFQFLAWCFEYAAFKRHGWGYPSSLPVALDGTCNGLQHYSAALRDREGGAAVNLLPADRPSDIYAVVAAKTEALVQEFVRPGGPDAGRIDGLPKLLAFWRGRGIEPADMAQAWLSFGIDRKITKRSVMTLPYGSTAYASRGFLEDAIEDRLSRGGLNPFTASDDPVERRRAFFNASLWLQPLLWQAIGETVGAARRAMDWLQTCAKLVCALDLPVSWTTPDGFLVQQAYRRWDKHRVETVLDGAVAKIIVAQPGLEVDRRAQQQAIAPNWVHSMDACALRLFVNLAVSRGLRDFALVHDSFGAPAAKVELMVACLKDAFVSLYTDNDPLLDFYFDILDQLPPEAVDKLPPPPSKGDLDIGLVRQSDYFFA